MALVAVPPAVATSIFPVVAPAGTTATSEVLVAERTLAAAPLKRTVFPGGVSAKRRAETVTCEPTAPPVGEKEAMSGGVAPGGVVVLPPPQPQTARRARQGTPARVNGRIGALL